MGQRTRHTHDWEIASYQLGKDHLVVTIVECCRKCAASRKYERPNKRLCASR